MKYSQNLKSMFDLYKIYLKRYKFIINVVFSNNSKTICSGGFKINFNVNLYSWKFTRIWIY